MSSIDIGSIITKLEKYERSFAVIGGIALSFILIDAVRKGPSAIIKGITGSVMRAALAIPGANDFLEKEITAELADDIAKAHPESISVLPDEPLSFEDIIAKCKGWLSDDVKESGFDKGTQFGGIYHTVFSFGDMKQKSDNHSQDLQTIQQIVSNIFLNTNQLYPSLFRTTRRLEAEVISFAVNILKGGLERTNNYVDPAPEACGLFAGGGTESILLAVKAHRDAALERLGYDFTSSIPPVIQAAKDGVILEVVAAPTAHPALNKGCELFGLKLVHVPVDSEQRLLGSHVASVLSSRTALVYASAPTFSHGVLDDIESIASVCTVFHSSPFGRDGVPVHVDNCLGGVTLSFSRAIQQGFFPVKSDSTIAFAAVPTSVKPHERLGLFDFRAGTSISSISFDLHKYGFAPKGASIVVFRRKSTRSHCYTVVPAFPGGLYATPTLAGSRSGAPAAVAWATLRFHGNVGYAANARALLQLYGRVVSEVKAIRGLETVGRSSACIVAFGTSKSAPFSSYSLAARMEERGWHVPLLQSPACLHVCITERFAEPFERSAAVQSDKEAVMKENWTVVDQWLWDLNDCVQQAWVKPTDPKFEGKGASAIYGAKTVLPDEMIGKVLHHYCDILTLVR